MGISCNVLKPKEVAKLHPLVNIHDLVGALHLPGDAVVSPPDVNHALATAAAAHGEQPALLVLTLTDANTEDLTLLNCNLSVTFFLSLFLLCLSFLLGRVPVPFLRVQITKLRSANPWAHPCQPYLDGEGPRDWGGDGQRPHWVRVLCELCRTGEKHYSSWTSNSFNTVALFVRVNTGRPLSLCIFCVLFVFVVGIWAWSGQWDQSVGSFAWLRAFLPPH